MHAWIFIIKGNDELLASTFIVFASRSTHDVTENISTGTLRSTTATSTATVVKRRCKVNFSIQKSQGSLTTVFDT